LSRNVALNEFDASLLAGFSEGPTFAALRADQHRAPPRERGVYAVVWPFESHPDFRTRGSAGVRDGRNPNVPTNELPGRWVRASRILYFGKAGGPGMKTGLRKRISAYSRFGLGRRAGHWGGRLVWQIDRSADLLVRWRPTPGDVPREVEHRLIQKFVAHYCKLPFANLIE
jgi:hypothetical protein